MTQPTPTSTAACTANRCHQGRAPCHCPQACELPADPLQDDRLSAAVGVLLALPVALGLINVIGQVPLFNAVAHNLTAACLLATLVLLMRQMHASAAQTFLSGQRTNPAAWLTFAADPGMGTDRGSGLAREWADSEPLPSRASPLVSE